MVQIRLQYQVKKPIHLFDTDTRERYEVKELMHTCDPNKSDRENLDDAFCKACDLGADPNKQVRWKFIESCDKHVCLFNNNGFCFSTKKDNYFKCT